MDQAAIGVAISRSGRSIPLSPGARSKTADFRRLRLNLYALVLLVDAVAMAGAYLLADVLRFGRLEGYGLTTFIVIFPTYVAVGLNGDSWSIDSLRSPRHSAASATRALILALAVATVVFFSLKVGADFSRLVFGLGSCIALVSIALARLGLGHAMGELCGWTFRREVLLLDEVTAAASSGEVVVDAAEAGIRPDAGDPALLDRLAQILARSERAIVACPAERRAAWARVLAGANIDVEILAPELAPLGALGLRRHGTTPALLVGCGPLPLRSRAAKRLLDLGLSSLALVFLAPLMLVIGLAIRLESPGPAVFTQVRMGRGNRLFRMLKFRSMRFDCADSNGESSAGRNDSRVTRIGRLLRRTSLDELPQLLNVLKGEMSIVGPRPHALGTRAGDRLLWTIDERYWDRHAIKPGLTGLAQVRGFRGATATAADLTNRLQSDLEYIDGWHIGRDIAIVVRTLGVLVHPNAF
ncbi:MAG TPA: sugar transferase [Sphingomicrobium sp.]|jgi:lipopolysaccharide/colanic/teichoic acid biosynthesis glycosyltransferase|nr:sugar transferase [Sphingomicrobium sp.]